MSTNLTISAGDNIQLNFSGRLLRALGGLAQEQDGSNGGVQRPVIPDGDGTPPRTVTPDDAASLPGVRRLTTPPPSPSTDYDLSPPSTPSPVTTTPDQTSDVEDAEISSGTPAKKFFPELLARGASVGLDPKAKKDLGTSKGRLATRGKVVTSGRKFNS